MVRWHRADQLYRGFELLWGGPGAPARTEREAWIDTPTRRPVKIRGPEGTFEFQFLDGAPTPLRPPAEAIEAWQAVIWQKQRLGQTVTPVPGFDPEVEAMGETSVEEASPAGP